jgi:hypothetical protein
MKPCFCAPREAASYEDLQAVARKGAVIFLISGQYSCNAIIVSTSGDPDPHQVPLSSFTPTDLSNLKDSFARAIRHASIIGLLKELGNDLIVILYGTRSCNPSSTSFSLSNLAVSNSSFHSYPLSAQLTCFERTQIALRHLLVHADNLGTGQV